MTSNGAQKQQLDGTIEISKPDTARAYWAAKKEAIHLWGMLVNCLLPSTFNSLMTEGIKEFVISELSLILYALKTVIPLHR